MSLETQINAVNCGANGVLGTGLAGCRKDRKSVVALGLVTKGLKFTAEFSKDALRDLQQSGDLIMLQGVVSFVDNTADDNIITREGSGEKVLAGKNPYEYTATFDNGVNFHKALNALESYRAYDMILFDVESNIWMTVTKAGEPKGFSLGMFNQGKYMGSNGTDASSQTVTFQLINRAEIDERMSFVDGDQWDASYDEITGVNEVVVTLDAVADGSTTISLSAYLLDKTHPVEGLLTGDFLLTRNGSTLSQTVTYNSTTKKYVFTVTANTAADTLTASLNGIVLTTLDVLYKSNTATGVVTA